MKPCLLENLGKRKGFKNNEEYKEFLRRQNHWFAGFIVFGILLAALGFGAEFLAEEINLTITIDDYLLGVYAGMGSALIGAGLAKIIRNRSTMKDEERLTKQRRERGDERIQEIGRIALRVAALLMILAMYVISLIGGLFYPVLPKILLILICIFLLVYVVTYRILEKRM